MIVLDTSLVGPIAIPDERDNLDIGAMAALVESAMIVPGHWRLEVANMLRTAVRRDRLTVDERDEILVRLGALQVEVDSETSTAAWGMTIDLSDRYGLTPYDAAYIELALRRRAPLATRDRALARAAEAADLKTMDFRA